MNKYWAKTLKIICIVLFLTTGANLFSSCNDDLPADSYYTFTGEMMSGFLQTREDFSLFRRIVERAYKLRSRSISERTWICFGRRYSCFILRYLTKSLFS